MHADGSVEKLGEGGTVLGVFAEAVYQQSSVKLNAGDRLLLYTDGITEAHNPAGEEFGEDRLARVASESDATSAEALKERILQELQDFTGGTFDDDATLIVVAGVS